MSGPVFAWIAEVMRACTPSPLIVSTSRLMPSAFWQSSLILLFNRASDAGTKSTNLSQCSVVPWAKAGARPLARMPARPPVPAATAPAPDSLSTRRRSIRCILKSLPVHVVAESAWRRLLRRKLGAVDLGDLVGRPLDRLFGRHALD